MQFEFQNMQVNAFLGIWEKIAKSWGGILGRSFDPFGKLDIHFVLLEEDTSKENSTLFVCLLAL